MRWSKVRKLVEESFAPSVRRRVSIHSSHSGRNPDRCSHDCGWGWITIDGEPIAWMDTHEWYKRFGTVPEGGRTGRLIERGEFSRFDLHRACWEYIHSSINESVNSADPLIQSLAVLSARVGKNRLQRVASRDLHPLTRELLTFRLRAEAPGKAPSVTAAVPRQRSAGARGGGPAYGPREK